MTLKINPNQIIIYHQPIPSCGFRSGYSYAQYQNQYYKYYDSVAWFGWTYQSLKQRDLLQAALAIQNQRAQKLSAKYQ